MTNAARRWVPGCIAVGLLAAAGCDGPRWLVDTPPAAPAPDVGGAKIFHPASSYGTISLRIVDQRPRAVQSINDVNPDDYNAVLFTLTHPKLKAPMRASFAKGSNNTYSSNFMVPPDLSANYLLQASIHRLSNSGVASASAPSYAEYGEAARRVGEGLSAPFAVLPASTMSVSVVINTVGQALIDSLTYVTASDSAVPELLAGDPTAYVAAPLINKAKFSSGILNLSLWTSPASTSTPVASYSLPYDAWPAAGAATISFTAPPFGNYEARVELASGSKVVSTLRRKFTVYNPVNLESITLR